MRHHEFLQVADSPYCGDCALPRANRRHKARPRTWSVHVEHHELEATTTTVYGPFADEADALTFADKVRSLHTTAEVRELEDPALATAH